MRPPFRLGASAEAVFSPVAQTSFEECVDKACKAAHYYEAAEHLHNREAERDFEKAFVLAVRGCYNAEAEVLAAVRLRCKSVSPYTLDYLERSLGQNVFYAPPWMTRPARSIPITVYYPPSQGGQMSIPRSSFTAPWTFQTAPSAPTTTPFQPSVRTFGSPH